MTNQNAFLFLGKHTLVRVILWLAVVFGIVKLIDFGYFPAAVVLAVAYMCIAKRSKEMFRESIREDLRVVTSQQLRPSQPDEEPEQAC